MSNGITEPPAAGIGKLIVDNRFAVPNHQRDFSWTDAEVHQLFDNILRPRLRKTTLFISWVYCQR